MHKWDNEAMLARATQFFLGSHDLACLEGSQYVWLELRFGENNAKGWVVRSLDFYMDYHGTWTYKGGNLFSSKHIAYEIFEENGHLGNFSTHHSELAQSMNR